MTRPFSRTLTPMVLFVHYPPLLLSYPVCLSLCADYCCRGDMTRSINIIQQPDCYRTYNKKTHIERAGLKGLLLDVGVHQSETMLARKLPARTRAAVCRFVRAGEIAGAAIRFLAASLAFAEQDRFVLGNVVGGEFVHEDQAAPILDRVGIRRRGVDICIVE